MKGVMDSAPSAQIEIQKEKRSGISVFIPSKSRINFLFCAVLCVVKVRETDAKVLCFSCN